MKTRIILILTLGLPLLTGFQLPLLGGLNAVAQDAKAVLSIQKAGQEDSVQSTDPEEAPETPELSEWEQEKSLSNREIRRANNEIVSYGKDVHVKSNEVANTVVVIGGSAVIDGKVSDAVVAIAGNVTVRGEAESAVAILGSVNMAAAGRAQEAVAIAGNVKVRDDAETGEAVAIGGSVDLSERGNVRGDKFALPVPGLSAPEWLQAWFNECLLKLRPLAPSVGWVWAVAGIFLLFYLFVALVFRGAVEACVNEVVDRPATTFLVGVLAKVVIPLVVLILIGTGIGIIVVPFVVVGAFVLGVLGKVALMEAIGVGLGRAFGTSALQNRILALFIGAVVLALLYMIPILGFLVFLLVGVWGLGAGVLATVTKMQRERPAKGTGRPAGPNWPGVPVGSMSARASQASSATTPAAQSMPASFAVPPGAMQGGAPISQEPAPESQHSSSNDPEAAAADTSLHEQPTAAQHAPEGAVPPIGHAAPYLSDAAKLASQPIRYAGFWERIGAAFLDVILIVVVANLASLERWWYVLALAYFAGMWTWRGTTIGGIVLGLKVARVDGQPLSFLVAIIRALTAAFSAVVLFLGFFWIGWDKDKQGWHDKVAGTVVVKSPKPTPLLILT